MGGSCTGIDSKSMDVTVLKRITTVLDQGLTREEIGLYSFNRNRGLFWLLVFVEDCLAIKRRVNMSYVHVLQGGDY